MPTAQRYSADLQASAAAGRVTLHDLRLHFAQMMADRKRIDGRINILPALALTTQPGLGRLLGRRRSTKLCCNREFGLAEVAVGRQDDLVGNC